MLDINLLPWRARKRETLQQKFLISLGAAVAFAILLLLFFHLFLNMRINYIQQDNKFLAKKIETLSSSTEVAKLFFIHQDYVEKSILLANQLQRVRDIPTKLLDLLVSLPTTIQLTSVTYKNNQLIVSALGNNLGTPEIDALIQQMNKTALFQEVKLADFQPRSAGENFSQSFKIIATLKVI